MTDEEYLKELERLWDERKNAEAAATAAQEPYRNALRKVDMVKEQIRQLKQAWMNEHQFNAE